MKASKRVVEVVAVFVICSYFLPIITSEAASLKQHTEGKASSPVNHAHRIKRDVSSNHTSTVNRTQVQNLTTTRAPTNAPTYKRPSFGRPWQTTRRNSATGSAMNSNSTGLTEVEMEKLKGNKSKVELDHLGFPKRPGTRQPTPLTKHTVSNNNRHPILEKYRNESYLHETMAELRRNGTQTSTLPSNTTTSIIETDKLQKAAHNDNRRDISLVISKHSIWIAVVASVILTAFSCLLVHWVRQRRRGKLTIAPANNKGQRPAAVVYKA
ncbi:hypothetical protein OS493_008806 [Desmophyllum pertusum]|uniref:Uncharacterized protein n=1 Tax=Desmophyllum pertusum TaxID=174260 RepID=A0A9X0D0I9_9CNID|nr:hypothetical protein OS493_008806 [Desmophyllum pertusum]